MDERNKEAGDQEVHLIPAQRMSGRGALGLGTLGHRVGKKKGKALLRYTRGAQLGASLADVVRHQAVTGPDPRSLWMIPRTGTWP
jgi:hypothetical protein